METKTLKLTDIRTDGGTQSRSEIHKDTVTEYADEMLSGAAFPAIVVFYDGKEYWLADGFHRVQAAYQAKMSELPAEIRQGSQRDAILHSVGANASHGLRRTNDDKRRAVMRLLKDDEWVQWSDRSIAEKCNVGHPLVARVRRELFPHTGTNSSVERQYVNGAGNIKTMNTSNIRTSNGSRRMMDEPSPDEGSIELGEQPASVRGGHLPSNAPVGTVYRNGKAEASAPLFSDVGTNTPFTHPAANSQPYTNGTGTPPVDSLKLQTEVDRLRAENAQLKAQVELNTPKMLIHIVNAASVSQDDANVVMRVHGEATARAALGLLIQYKVKPHDFAVFTDQLVKLVKDAGKDPLEEQRKADEKAAKKAAKRVYPANVNTWKLQHMMDYYAANGEALDALRHALGIDTDMIHWDDSSMNERREYVKLFQELERTHVSTDCYSKMIAYARSKWADIPVYKMADRISEWKQSLTPVTASVIPGDDPRYHTITHPDIEGAEIPDYVAPQQVPA